MPAPGPEQQTIALSNASSGITIIGEYRYELWRQWEAAGETACWIMLNPADNADEARMVKRVRHWTKAAGLALRRAKFGKFIIVNLYAYQVTDPQIIKAMILSGEGDPVGPMNNTHIRCAIASSSLVIAAWGASLLPQCKESLAARVAYVKAECMQYGRTLYCLGHTQNGEPLHPAGRNLKMTTRLRPL